MCVNIQAIESKTFKNIATELIDIENELTL
jgi:hypothetical protein